MYKYIITVVTLKGAVYLIREYDDHERAMEFARCYADEQHYIVTCHIIKS